MFRCHYWPNEQDEKTDEEKEMEKWKALEDELIEAARATDPAVQALEADNERKAEEFIKNTFEFQTKTMQWSKISTVKPYSNKLEDVKDEETPKLNVKGNKKKQEGVPYQIMVYLALVNANGRGINVQQIYSFIQRVFVKYRQNYSEAWKSSVRHQLATFKSSLDQKPNKGADLYKLKDEHTPLHLKYEQFCEKQLILESFGLADDVSWDLVTEGLVGIPEVMERRPIARAKMPRKRSSKATDEEADAVEAILGLQKRPNHDFENSWRNI